MVTAKVVSKVSKTGKRYVCVVVEFPNGYKKTVFLDKAEEFIAVDFCDEIEE